MRSLMLPLYRSGMRFSPDAYDAGAEVELKQA